MAEGTHFQKFAGRIRTQADNPTSPQTGEVFMDTDNGFLMVYNGTTWVGIPMTTSTSTSTSTTSTSTSTS